ncbi:hypothetical protein GE21DRAFT_5324 [Neurospora crassa]|uniref:Uncharacterized protein n=1 Tax=Neurospora crassa (strain ATCC 24698 / 74-OR23-1A / CBS 708.71 / DSM 1257 / FGSC 987) TaxID=367110 RepID=V5IMZ6_NEUCR|nr:hypothetical protein NCU16738 [Neurospora crassa OR74A]ESA42765.1 hypothetical protein NCU16738 [Neurospora crassa OR74A]KHE81909.1 hypothetical protein GE21DRAFT_5324 [Neurospora crassa]|eukprot:XP_011394359.1 hypothetical protein NCU16738 [Neurospora crassa OR74A]
MSNYAATILPLQSPYPKSMSKAIQLYAMPPPKPSFPCKTTTPSMQPRYALCPKHSSKAPNQRCCPKHTSEALVHPNLQPNPQPNVQPYVQPNIQNAYPKHLSTEDPQSNDQPKFSTNCSTRILNQMTNPNLQPNNQTTYPKRDKWGVRALKHLVRPLS